MGHRAISRGVPIDAHHHSSVHEVYVLRLSVARNDENIGTSLPVIFYRVG